MGDVRDTSLNAYIELRDSGKFFNEMIEAEGGPSTEELRAEKLHEEYLDDCKSDDMEAMGMDESIEYNDE